VFVNWLTHAQSATWYDATVAQETSEHVLWLASSLVVRHIRSVPDQCPKCGSRLSPEAVWREDLPEVAWERPICDDCDWTGQPVPVGERSADAADDEVFTREGGDNDKCVIPAVPLMKLGKPGDV
jgi:hypothetical protein